MKALLFIVILAFATDGHAQHAFVDTTRWVTLPTEFVGSGHVRDSMDTVITMSLDSLQNRIQLTYGTSNFDTSDLMVLYSGVTTSSQGPVRYETKPQHDTVHDLLLEYELQIKLAILLSAFLAVIIVIYIEIRNMRHRLSRIERMREYKRRMDNAAWRLDKAINQLDEHNYRDVV